MVASQSLYNIAILLVLLSVFLYYRRGNVVHLVPITATDPSQLKVSKGSRDLRWSSGLEWQNP